MMCNKAVCWAEPFPLPCSITPSSQITPFPTIADHQLHCNAWHCAQLTLLVFAVSSLYAEPDSDSQEAAHANAALQFLQAMLHDHQPYRGPLLPVMALLKPCIAPPPPAALCSITFMGCGTLSFTGS